MTRFARAKGSKASNEREPEEATPWSQMVSGIKTKNVDVEDLGDDLIKNEEIEDDSERRNPAGKDEESEEEIEKSVVEEVGRAEEQSPSEKKKKKKKRKQDKCLNCKEKGHLKRECPKLPEERRTELQELYQMKIERKGKGIGRKKNKKKDKKEDNVEVPKSGKIEKKTDKKFKWKRELKDKTGKVVQEGEGLFQGFRVRLEDVKRLRKLHKKLTAQKDVSKEEIKEALKKERRRAENDLTRSKKTVCYNCRKPGHFLSDCPEKDDDERVLKTVGQCFKCGSSEHSSKDCKSKLKGEDAYKFAVCFICKEAGHLAKACPDNPRGLYPKGGCCRFCGSVEHLKSQCLRKSEKDSRDEVKVGRIGGLDNVEDEPEFIPSPSKKSKKDETKNKIVKF